VTESVDSGGRTAVLSLVSEGRGSLRQLKNLESNKEKKANRDFLIRVNRPRSLLGLEGKDGKKFSVYINKDRAQTRTSQSVYTQMKGLSLNTKYEIEIALWVQGGRIGFGINSSYKEN